MKMFSFGAVARSVLPVPHGQALDGTVLPVPHGQRGGRGKRPAELFFSLCRWGQRQYGAAAVRSAVVLCLLSFGFSAFAADQELCTVGVTEINSSLTNTIVAVSYDDLGSDSDMVVSNLVKTTNLTVGDKLAVFNNSKTYDTWILTEGAGGAKFWAKQDKTYTVDGNGQLTVNTGVDAATTIIGVGTGLWLTRQDVSKPFYLYGKPASGKSVTVAANSWALVGNPTQESVTIGTDKAISASEGDQIVAFGANGKLWYYTYWEGGSDEGWHTTDAQGEWMPASPTIGAGLGFWIRLKNGTTIEW